MSTYLAEFFLSGTDAGGPVDIAERVQQASDHGGRVHFVRAVSVPAQEFCLVVFRAPSAAAVESAVRAAGLVLAAPPEEVQLVEALELLDRRATGCRNAAKPHTDITIDPEEQR